MNSDITYMMAALDAWFKETIPDGWTLANLNQGDDKTWFCEMREGHLTGYTRVVMSETRYSSMRPETPSQALMQCLLQINKK